MRESTKDKKFVVYIHRNLINGKVYIGQTCNLSERWRSGGKNYFNSIKFFNAIKKYGWNNFSHEVLYDNLNQEAANTLEKELIEKYDSINNGYNLKEGGARGALSEESLKKMRDSIRKGFVEHPERREKIRQKALGRQDTPETRHKRSLSNRRTILIDIDGEVGSLRYWGLKVGKSHGYLSKILRTDGMVVLKCKIKELFWTQKGLDEFKKKSRC